MTMLKSTYSSMTFRTQHLNFWNNIMKIELTEFCENLNKLIEEILKYSINFTNEDCFYLSETIFGLSNEDIELLNNTITDNIAIMNESLPSIISEIDSKISGTYKNKKNNIICTNILETPYISATSPEEQVNEPFYFIHYNIWEYSKMKRIHFTIIMKYLHDVAIRMAMLKSTIIKIELVCYSKKPTNYHQQYHKKKALDILVNDQVMQFIELNKELIRYSGEISKIHYYTDSMFLYPNAMALMARYY